jgi:hypothetical protein
VTSCVTDDDDVIDFGCLGNRTGDVTQHRQLPNLVGLVETVSKQEDRAQGIAIKRATRALRRREGNGKSAGRLLVERPAVECCMLRGVDGVQFVHELLQCIQGARLLARLRWCALRC